MELPVGLGFFPSDEQIAGHYLPSLASGDETVVLNAMSRVSFSDYDPWQLPTMSRFPHEKGPWYFLTPLATGERLLGNLIGTPGGRWIVTSENTHIFRDGGRPTRKRVLVFLEGEREERTAWVTHEFHQEYPNPENLGYVIYKLVNMELPLGVGFFPSDDDIARHYLPSLREGDETVVLNAMNKITFSSYDPWQLPRMSKFPSERGPWYFLTRLPTREIPPNVSRRTPSGRWNQTGTTEIFRDGLRTVRRRVLKFLEGEREQMTDWVIHEFFPEFFNPYIGDYRIYKLKR